MKNTISFFNLFLFLSSIVNAQIIYNDAAPDVLISTGDYPNNLEIDINDDGVIDLVFKHAYTANQYYAYGKTTIKTLGEWEVSSSYFARCYEYGELINEESEWRSGESLILQEYLFNENVYFGNWFQKDGFLGLRLKDGSDYYYSWLRIYALDSNENSILYAGGAFNQMLNETIYAGDGLPQGVTGLVSKDVADNFDGQDIMVSFTKAFNESMFSEYRVFLAHESDEYIYDSEYLSQLNEDKYYSIPINENPDTLHGIIQYLEENTIDIEGNEVQPLENYKTCVLSIHKNGNWESNVLSSPSNIFFLEIENKAVEDLLAIDQAANGNPSDILLSFNETMEELYLLEYRVFLIKYEEINDFTIEDALQLGPDYYTAFEASLGETIGVLNENQLDFKGNIVEEDCLYEIMLVSVADSIYAKTSMLAEHESIVISQSDYLRAGQKDGNGITWYPCDSLFCKDSQWIDFYNWGYNDIDVNRDGLYDFKLMVYLSSDWTGGEAHIYNIPYRNNKALKCNHVEHQNWASNLKFLQAIGEKMLFTSDTVMVWNHKDAGIFNINTVYYDSGHYNHTGIVMDTVYFGFQVNDNGDQQHAWVRIFEGRFIDYAFQDFGNSIIETSMNNRFLVYPNPAEDFINIQILINLTSNPNIEIFNLTGIQMGNYKLSEKNTMLDISQYPSGIYLLKFVESGEILETQRIVVY